MEPPSEPLRREYADRSPSFAHEASYTFVLGNKDRATSASLLSCYPSTRVFGPHNNSLICKLDGDFAEFVPADEEFRVDQASKSIVPR